MKKYKYVVLLLVLFFAMPVNALKRDNSSLLSRNNCAKYELAKANTDGSITNVSCFNDYNSAKLYMDSLNDESLFILEIKTGANKVVDAKYGLVYLDRGDKVTYLYSSSDLKSNITYMDNYDRYGATDAALIEVNYSKSAVKIKIGSATGWVKKSECYIIPINWVKSSSFYRINDKGVYHFYAKDIELNNYSQSSRQIDEKPTFISNGDYKSYDGIYFYSNYISMIDDYRTGKHEKAVNKDNAYYNYYQYLPHRSKTNYDIDDFDSYIRNVLGFKGSLYGKFLTSNNSVMYGTSEYYLYAEKQYGANALSIFSLGRHESGNGRSQIAYKKNNIFGHNAVDGSAYDSANGYLDVRSSIYTHGYGYVNYGYARVSDSRYNGSHFGTKATGMNVLYASDVYWGEKAASYYYSFDKENGFLDRNYYQLIVSNCGDINVRVAPKTSSKVVYNIKKSNIPFIVIEEVEGETVGGNNIWYKIQSDSNVTNEGSLISSNSTTWPAYNWAGYAYVHSNYFTKINNAKNNDGTYNKPIDVKKDSNGYTINTKADKSKYNPEVGLLNKDVDYYYTSSLTSKKGTIKKGSYVVILEEIISGDEKNYLIITDYGTIQKHWISSTDVKVLNKDLLSVKIDASEGTISVLDAPGGKSVLSVYNGSFLPIIGKKITNGKTYLQVEYKVAGSTLYGYVDGSINNISYTLNYLNGQPVINASDKTIVVNEVVSLTRGVTATDPEDGDLTSKVVIAANNVNFTRVGSYYAKYCATDSFGDTNCKTVTINVIDPVDSSPLFMFNGLKHVSANQFNFSGFIAVKGMDNKDIKQEIIFVNELTNKEYVFPLTKWTEYPYEMTDDSSNDKYDYSGGWFNTTIDLTKDKLPNGNYTIYVKAINGTHMAKALFTNVAYVDMTRRAKGDNREFLIDVDYSTLNSPLVFDVRDNLISLDTPKTLDPMYNFFTDISLNNNTLNIKGTSHSYGVSFKTSDTVDRKLILENIETFQRIEFDLGSITNGDYVVTLPVSDNMDKTKAWFNKSIDLSSVPVGNYALYIKNNVNGVTNYGEVIDAAYTDFSKINNKNYIFKRNDNRRLRIELEVKK